ncbi:MAG: RNA polymerase sigma factor [Gemmataceae bacterium]
MTPDSASTHPPGWADSAEPTDRSLVERWRLGDEAAATDLVRRYCTRLHALIAARSSRALAAHVEPEDIVQSVFRAVFQGVRTQGYAVPDHQELWGLLLVLALNKIRNHERDLRAGKRDVQRVEGGGIDLERLASRDDAAPAFLRLVMEDELRDWPAPHQLMVRLRLEGHELAGIAARTRRSTRTVERVLQTFRQKLADVP